MLRLRLVCALLLLPLAAYAQRQMTVAELTSFIKSSVAQKNPDTQVADYVRKSVKLSEKLDDRTVAELQGLGAGPKTVAALRALSDSSASLPAPVPPPAPAPKVEVVAKPAPSADEQKEILAKLTEYAHDYTKNLPDFICTQVTFQRVDPKGGEAWNLAGTVQEHLTYVEGREDYKVVMVNNRPANNMSHMQVGGNKSEGEFGTMLAEIFDPESHTDFAWARWTTWHSRSTYVFSFRVEQEYSRYTIKDEQSGRTTVPGYHGLVYADRDTGTVMRITMECDDIPAGFPIRDVSEILDYDFQKIGAREYVLPVKAELRSHNGRTSAFNQIEFRLYRKYSADASITFDPPEPLPDK
jgi:hypothetical protein